MTRRAYSTTEVAEMLGFGPGKGRTHAGSQRVLRQIHAGQIKAIKFGASYRVPDYEVDRLLSEAAQPARSA